MQTSHVDQGNIQYNFEGQVVIVTGGTRGIGRAISEKFLEAKAHVVAIYRSNDEAANQFKSDLGDLGERLHLKKLDVCSYSDCEKFYNELDQQFENIHVLVNNSGIRRDNLLLLMKEDMWDSVIETNLKGTFNMTKFATQRFLKSKYGRIVNMSSIAGTLGLQGQANYSASKAGQIAFSKSVGKEVAKRGITINNITPGFVETELISDLPEKLVDEYKKQVPMKRFATTDEISVAVLFLSSREASYITGATVEIAGGLN
ncbi:MAG: 3-oxoacyl-ACP reductase FabG [Halobacteriovoraceae bacterium]|nr:3-oxoacyl-ACP reductase FabG [Halobacteriovoraceae bacterium]MCB9093539.1 3-oxoacyl-ACP reductase FabG [Halobacteriovoraceae bacterium]